MCRLAALPPGVTRTQAIEYLAPWATYNRDGTGSVHLGQDKAFAVDRHPTHLGRAVKRGFLNHLPHDGWTVVHLRAATHGKVAVRNTHPFVHGAWSVCHNGVWSGHSIVKAALEGSVEFKGETDSEVAAYLLANVGPKRFYDLMPSGVYLALNRSGELWAVKEGVGDLKFAYPDGDYGSIVVLSDDRGVHKSVDSHEVTQGWFHFDAVGRLKEHLRFGEVVTGPARAKFEPTATDDDDESDFLPRHFAAGGQETTPRRHWWHGLPW